VYAFNKELFSADGYYAIPTNELAFTYYVAAIDEANIATQFAISATTETDIQISLPDDGESIITIFCVDLLLCKLRVNCMNIREYGENFAFVKKSKSFHLQSMNLGSFEHREKCFWLTVNTY